MKEKETNINDSVIQDVEKGGCEWQNAAENSSDVREIERNSREDRNDFTVSHPATR